MGCIYEKPADMLYMPSPVSRIVVLVTLLKIRPRIISQVTLLYFNPVAKLVLYSLTIYIYCGLKFAKTQYTRSKLVDVFSVVNVSSI